MKTALRLGAAGALAFAGVAAHASINPPSSGSGDAILFAEVENAAGTAVVASYAGDTGISVSSLIGGTTNYTGILGSDSNLAKLFAADASGDTIYFAVLGGQYTGTNTVGNVKTAGVAQYLTTALNNSPTTNGLSLATSNSLVYMGTILNSTIASVNTNSGGASSVEAASSASGGIWDTNVTTGNLSTWGGATVKNANPLGTTANLYYVTAGTPAGNATKVAYTLEGTFSLSSNGLSFTSANQSAVPLPPAVWLLGSGLLGLAGIARRKVQG